MKSVISRHWNKINNMRKKIFENINKIIEKIIISPYTIRVISLIILAEMMAFPFSMDKMNLTNSEQVIKHLYPFTVLSSGLVERGFNFFYISCLSFFIFPAFFILIVISFFQKKINEQIISLFSFIAVTLYLSSAISGMILFANTARWFQSLNFSVYLTFFSALIFHVFLIAHKIISIKAQNESYSEYKNLLLEEEKKEEELYKRKIEKLKKRQEVYDENSENNLNIKDLLKKYIQESKQKLKEELKNEKRKSHIKTKIVIVIFFTISVILSTFIYTDLKNYKTLFAQTVNNTGKNQAEQVAAIYYFSDGLHAKIRAFLEGIRKTNSTSPFPFQRVDIITTSNKTPIYIEKIDSSTELPLFDVFSYTTAIEEVHNISEEEKQITPEEASLYLAHFQNEQTKSEPIYNPKKGTAIYICPIIFSRKEGQRLIGFSVVTYFTEILNLPYFQAKVFVFSISAIFLYASIIITLFLADFIANPIIFLCGSIRKTANILEGMLSGNAKIEATKLIFDEKIRTNDEIKNLSKEMGNIISLVRGILPYVSFHTIRNAEKNINRPGITRDLCFLFTDIRGFTTLCEGLPPKDVIPILNHYLDIETKIIFNNGGDVDKYVGDEMMAFFSGSKKEIKACMAALEIRKAMLKEHRSSIEEGATPISIGIGINSGPVVFGSVGSKTRKDFTSIGDTVNLAARLEGANKEYGSKTIISESVYENLNNTFVCRELDYVTVKGKTEPVRIFEILDTKTNITEDMQNLKKLFETGLSHYRKRRWKSAEKYFLKCKEKYNDEPSKVFLNRIAHYQLSPPDSKWKGVFIMSVK